MSLRLQFAHEAFAEFIDKKNLRAQTWAMFSRSILLAILSVFLGLNAANGIVLTNDVLEIAAGETYYFSTTPPQRLHLQDTNGNTISFEIAPERPISSEQPIVIAGPATLALTGFEEQVGPDYPRVPIQARRVTNSLVKTLFVNIYSALPELTNGVIQIPEGKTAHFLTSAGGTWIYNGLTNDITEFNAPFELEGPSILKVEFGHPENVATVVSYFFTDSSLPLEDGSVLSGSGRNELTVEKSYNLTNWFPTVVQPLSPSQKAFFRLKLSH